MKSNKVGYVTLNKYNYGSALQCYATSFVLKKLGLEPFLINVVNKNKISTLFELFKLCVCHPLSIKSILKNVKSSRSKSLIIDKNSLSMIDEFIDKNINTILSNDKLDDYLFFLSGSDQVWNSYRCLGIKSFFLSFVPSKKRNSWAASFGGDSVAKYNVRRYKKYLKSFNHISVREQSGASIVKKMLPTSNPVIHIDPIFLLTSDEWKMNEINQSDREYVFVFFLDNPSEKIIKTIKAITNMKIIALGYYYDCYKSLGIEFRSGGPLDFLSYINNTSLILTDSFHATAFSLLFHKNVYAFSRNYTHNQNQSTRITELFKQSGIVNRFDNYMLDSDAIDFNKVDSMVKNAKKESFGYLEGLIKEYENR